MAVALRSVDLGQAGPVQDLVRLQPGGRSVVQAGSRLGSVPEYNTSQTGHIHQGQLAIVAEISAQKEARKNVQTAYQNAEAIVKYSKKDKAVVREGKHAAAVDQLHQNNLHNIEKVSDEQQSRDNVFKSNGMILDFPEKTKNGGKKQAAGSKSVRSSEQESELITSFDPMKDRHRWAMWRTAVNGRIVDETRRLEKGKIQKGPGADLGTAGAYGSALMVPPLRQFIKFDSDENEAVAKQMLGHGPLILKSFQFVYFGLPRVQLAKLAK